MSAVKKGVLMSTHTYFDRESLLYVYVCIDT